jgi:hypothetical protein
VFALVIGVLLCVCVRGLTENIVVLMCFLHSQKDNDLGPSGIRELALGLVHVPMLRNLNIESMCVPPSVCCVTRH